MRLIEAGRWIAFSAIIVSSRPDLSSPEAPVAILPSEIKAPGSEVIDNKRSKDPKDLNPRGLALARQLFPKHI